MICPECGAEVKCPGEEEEEETFDLFEDTGIKWLMDRKLQINPKVKVSS